MSFDAFQQVFLLSLASNLVNYSNGTQENLQKALQLSLAGVLPTIGSWEVVWGPVVWKKNPDNAKTGPGNSWYVAFHPNLEFGDGSVHPTYVIATAGTPEDSAYVWFYQSFAVHSVVNFNLWVANGIHAQPEVVPPRDIVPGTPYIATGIANPVHVILNTAAPVGARGAGLTLLDFASSIDISDDTRFVATGHSLGGALSPSLALALVSSGIIPSYSALTYPTAGPSPGNSAFTDLFTATFPPLKSANVKSYQGWNLNLVNTLDIVPHAWPTIRATSPTQNMDNIPTIYGNQPPLPLVQGLTFIGKLHALRSGVLYHPLPSQLFTGTPPTAPPQNLTEYLRIFGPQHGQVYYDEAGITPPTLRESEGLTPKTEKEIWYSYHVAAGFTWALDHPEEVEKEIEAIEGTPETK